MIFLKHRFASGSLASLWDFDPKYMMVLVVHRAISLEIPVCGASSPRLGAFSISRRSETEWQVAPARYVKRGSVWVAMADAFDGEDRLREFLILTHSTDRANEELEKLL